MKINTKIQAGVTRSGCGTPTPTPPPRPRTPIEV
jgi:hypothetical protein